MWDGEDGVKRRVGKEKEDGKTRVEFGFEVIFSEDGSKDEHDE